MKFNALPQAPRTLRHARRMSPATRLLAGLTTWPVICLLALSMCTGALIAGDEMGPPRVPVVIPSATCLHCPPPPGSSATGGNGDVLDRRRRSSRWSEPINLVIHDALRHRVSRVVLGNRLVRYEFYGRVTVLLDRLAFQSSFVSTGAGAHPSMARCQAEVDGVLGQADPAGRLARHAPASTDQRRIVDLA